MGILYLGEQRSRLVCKSLNRHGKVYHAPDINEALLLIAEHDFDYYFVDADTPHAQAFIKHIQHDPQLISPKAVVLLTDNEEEDCEAWAADTFITKSKICEDLPYIFSHLRGEPPEQASVVRIAPDRVDRPGTVARNEIPRKPFRRERNIPEQSTGEEDQDSVAPGPAGQSSEYPGRGGKISNAESVHSKRLRLTAVAFSIVMVGLWLFVWGPFSSSSGRHGAQTNGRKNVEAETSDSKRVKGERVETEGAEGSATVVYPESAPVPENTPAATVSESSDSQPATPAPATLPTPAPTPPPEPVNHAPTVSISGPAQVNARVTATYTAVASDPDGDNLSYSWGSSTRSTAWSVPGLYSISVTVTDSHGASNNASISVRVI